MGLANHWHKQERPSHLREEAVASVGLTECGPACCGKDLCEDGWRIRRRCGTGAKAGSADIAGHRKCAVDQPPRISPRTTAGVSARRQRSFLSLTVARPPMVGSPVVEGQFFGGNPAPPPFSWVGWPLCPPLDPLVRGITTTSLGTSHGVCLFSLEHRPGDFGEHSVRYRLHRRSSLDTHAGAWE